MRHIFFSKNRVHAFFREYGILLFILVIASLLRFYHALDIPLTHDEYSALGRLDYNSFSALLEQGVRLGDTHPAGVQVFLYYYIRLFGQQAFVVKLPFLILGVLSVFMVYKIALLWFNKTAAVFASSVYASLQYLVVNSQIARPYGFGLFFCLLVAWYGTKYFYFNRQKPFYILGLILASVICMYTHYFATLFIAVFYMVLLFLVKPKRQKIMLLGIMGILVLAFLPHLPITLDQMVHKSGIQGWIGPYKITFLAVYFLIVAHQSIVVTATYIVVWLGLFHLPESNFRLILFSFSLFVLSWFIGSIYSVFFQNIMHERVLYFVFPFLLFAFSGFLRPISIQKQWLLTFLLLGVTSFSLIFERHHFELFYKNRYALANEKGKEWVKSFDSNQIAVIHCSDSIGLTTFQNHADLLLNTRYSKAQFALLHQFLRTSKANSVLFLATDKYLPEYYQLINSFFPHVLEKDYTVGGEFYLFSKADQSEEINSPKVNTRYKPNFPVQLQLTDYYFSKYNYIDLLIYPSSASKPEASAYEISLLNNGKLIHKQKTYSFSDSTAKPIELASLRLIDMSLSPETILKIQNLDGGLADSIRIICRPGNPFIYAHVKKIPADLYRFE